MAMLVVKDKGSDALKKSYSQEKLSNPEGVNYMNVILARNL